MSSEIFNSCKNKRVSVVVLGDFGRSPRMQYHALSLSKNSFQVDVVAYKGAEPLEQVVTNDNIHLHYMKDVPKFLERFPTLLKYIFKTFWQAFFLLCALLNIPKIDCILLQNPPSIPALPVCRLICWIRSSYLFVDFHNYGFTIMELTARKGSLLVRIAKWCEKYFGHKADKSICVTKAMKDDLNQNWNVRASVFYDCAPDIFHPITLEEKHEFFLKMSKDVKQFHSKSTVKEDLEGKTTRFTKNSDGKCEMLPNRPALIVSSTSWTEDEDFSILLSALEDYEVAAKSIADLPCLLVAITGKGPLKSFYQKEIEKRNFSHVEVITLWLKFEDYPTLLACADLGVSLHNSSSGLDLPMKVVDMFGCRLPVAAVSFNCIDELVKDGVNGLIFKNSKQLSEQLQTLFGGFPRNRTILNTYSENLKNTSSLKWEENWSHTVLPLLKEIYAMKALHQNC